MADRFSSRRSILQRQGANVQ